jgi:uncharacterized protein (TIGR00251 family)
MSCPRLSESGLHPSYFVLHPFGMPSTLELRVTPNASRDEAVGWVGPVLRLKIRAPALDGRANEAVCAFLAGRLGVPRRAVTLLRGEKSRQKVVRIDGLEEATVRSRLSGSAN